MNSTLSITAHRNIFNSNTIKKNNKRVREKITQNPPNILSVVV